MERIVIALGGNALGDTASEQIEMCKHAAKPIVDLVEAGNSLIIAHGNGPQVGQINLAFDGAMPFPECIAMSQGYIGYHLQQSIDLEIEARGRKGIPVVAMLTQVVVDENDPAFKNPTKPIGGYYDEEAARKIMAETGHVYKEDSGRGWRRVVASPKPVGIYERISLKTLTETQHVVIAGGGGGIPVIFRDKHYEGVDAVVDKDFAAAKMAELLDADVFIILTAVDRICLNFNTPNEKQLVSITVSEAEKYIKEGHFAPGSMLPKVQAACMFAASGKNKRAIVGSLEKAGLALKGQSGTVIVAG